MDQENAIQVFSFKEQEVRVVDVDGTPWWVAKDVCDVLELDNVSMALERLDEDEKLTSKILMSGQNRDMWLINEPGLYTLIIRSNKPEAKSFKRWVTHEVLPSLRENGFYFSGMIERSEESTLRTLLRVVCSLEERVAKLEAFVFTDRFTALEAAQKAIQGQIAALTGVKELPKETSPAPPFRRVFLHNISHSFDTDAQQYIAENLKGVQYGEKKRVWVALKEIAAERGWKVGSMSSFYRFCTALTQTTVFA